MTKGTNHKIEGETASNEAAVTFVVGGETSEITVEKLTDRIENSLATGGTLPLDNSWVPEDGCFREDSAVGAEEKNRWFYTRRRRKRHRVVSTE